MVLALVLLLPVRLLSCCSLPRAPFPSQTHSYFGFIPLLESAGSDLPSKAPLLFLYRSVSRGRWERRAWMALNSHCSSGSFRLTCVENKAEEEDGELPLLLPAVEPPRLRSSGTARQGEPRASRAAALLGQLGNRERTCSPLAFCFQKPCGFLFCFL